MALPLTKTVPKSKLHPYHALLDKLHFLFHLLATATLLCYRVTQLIRMPFLSVPHALITLAEFIFAFVWLLTQAFLFSPLTRTALPENIPPDTSLPGIDAFICTADPRKEPTLDVMNTVISALSLDYPSDKLSVYLSDDGGSSITLGALKEAFLFAEQWVPFCRKYGVVNRCPQAYFSRFITSSEFTSEQQLVQEKYEAFKKRVEEACEDDNQVNSVIQNHPAHVEIISENRKDGDLPRLVYVSREKRPHVQHRFKAGALNSLLRVSGVISNGAYVLVLDCDMYCNDPSSAKQALCFHSDPEVAFVQFPQMFHNVSKKDIYDGQCRAAFKTKWQGMDGLRGPGLSGTGFYMKRKALYGRPNGQDVDEFLGLEAKRVFGASQIFIASVKGKDKPNAAPSADTLFKEAELLAGCDYEKSTQWGDEVGFSYVNKLESTFTGYMLHCRGWTSVYLCPERPCFLGCATVDLKDAMEQLMKWSSNLLQMGVSTYSPFTYGFSRMSILQSMCYGYFTSIALLSIPLTIYATVPQLCFIKGTALFPKASDPWFSLFATVYASALAQHLHEVLFTGGSITVWWYEQRIWIVKSITACLFGFIDCLKKFMGLNRRGAFILTNKAVHREQLRKYEKGKFNFQGASTFMIPLVTLPILNLVCFAGGLYRMITDNNLDEMFGQLFLSSLILVMTYQLFEGRG
uniref:Uncharacterized protein n=1 Tax=Kalanchoe fedtschenkoi TaxID=63787 RepID=A0A7N0USY3_KALFE